MVVGLVAATVGIGFTRTVTLWLVVTKGQTGVVKGLVTLNV